MKKSLAQVAYALVAVQAAMAQLTNAVHLKPTNNLAAAHSSFQDTPFFRIAPNTAAFEQYAVDFMITQANQVREKWSLEISKPLTIHDVFFYAKPTAQGIHGGIETRDSRFHWVFDKNALHHFWDSKYAPVSFRYQDDESARLAKIKCKIGAQEAEAIACKALHYLGITEEMLHLKKSPEVNQYKFEESDGTVYPLPVFNITWRFEGPKQYIAENLESSPIQMAVSGITKSVVDYSNSEVFNSESRVPRMPIPTNYFEMLGLPENYLETVPERNRALWGLPPLSNLPAAPSKHSTSNTPPTATPPAAERKSAF